MNEENLPKKQLKKQRRIEKKQLEIKQSKNIINTRLVIGALIIAAVGIFFIKSNNSATITEYSERYKGNENATVVMEEYSDFQCPACAGTSAILKKVLEEYGDRVKLVYKNFPLVSIHPNSIPGARAAEAAGQQGKFWEMHDKLFESQSDWSNERDVIKKFEEYAKDLGLDVEKFKIDYNDKALLKKINTERAEAIALKLNATPTLFLNGEKIQNPGSIDGFKLLFDEVLKDSTASAKLDLTE